MTFSIHQFLPTWEPGAIGAHALALHETCIEAGIECTTWASEIKPGLAAIARLAEEFLADRAPRRGSVLLYHCAVGAPLGDQLLERSEPLVLNHHNVTPPIFFDAWHPAMAENLEVGEAQVAKLARHCGFGIADSTFNAQQLQHFGCSNTEVAPVFMNLEKPVSSVLESRLRSGAAGTKWLFVGRIAPNKAQHELVRAFAWYRQAYDPAAQLWLVGEGPADGYTASLTRLIDHLGVADGIVMAGSVSEQDLGAYYAVADVFVSLSAHEGFGVPLVEAMAARVPVVALAAAAVAETVGDAAVLVDRCDPGLVAGCVARVMRDAVVRDALIAAGDRRALQFSRSNTAQRWVQMLQQVSATLP